MPIPDFQSLIRPVLEKSANSEIKTSEVWSEALANDLGLSPEERAQLLRLVAKQVRKSGTLGRAILTWRV